MKYLIIITAGLAFIIGFNVFLLMRDRNMFKAYDRVCAEYSQSHSHCRYAK
jgi:hypothetical protein